MKKLCIIKSQPESNLGRPVYYYEVIDNGENDKVKLYSSSYALLSSKELPISLIERVPDSMVHFVGNRMYFKSTDMDAQSYI